MYWITKLLNGKFYCEGRVQDGTERWEEPTLEKAVKSMKVFAKMCNRDKRLGVKDIRFFQICKVGEEDTTIRDWCPEFVEKKETILSTEDHVTISSLFLSILGGDASAACALVDKLEECGQIKLRE